MDLKHETRGSDAALSAGQSEYDTKSQSKRGSTGASLFSCLSMSSDLSRGEPPVFSISWNARSYERPRERPRDSHPSVHTLKVMRQTAGHDFEDHLLGERGPEDVALELFQRKLKSSLKQKYEPLVARTQRTTLYVTEGLRHMEQVWTNQRSPERPMDSRELFKAGPGSRVRTVLTTGGAGVGKSVLVQRSIVDWCEDQALQNVQLLCPLPCAQLHLLQGQSWTVMELLWTFCPGLRESGLLDLSHCRLLFILDGLDQCRLKLDFSTKLRSCDPEEVMPVDALLTNLMWGNLLPDAQLWITCRPAAALSIPPTLIHRVTQVRGFSRLQKEAYFLQNIQDEDQTGTDSFVLLRGMDHLPLFCSIKASACAQSITHMLLLFLSHHMLKMQQTYGVLRSRVTSVIRGLCEVAHEQLHRGRRLFAEEHLTACGLEVPEALVYSGLCDITEDHSFSFVHESVQEFLAALFVHMFICDEKEHLCVAHPLLQLCLMELRSSEPLLTRMELRPRDSHTQPCR